MAVQKAGSFLGSGYSAHQMKMHHSALVASILEAPSTVKKWTSMTEFSLGLQGGCGILQVWSGVALGTQQKSQHQQQGTEETQLGSALGTWWEGEKNGKNWVKCSSWR